MLETGGGWGGVGGVSVYCRSAENIVAVESTFRFPRGTYLGLNAKYC